MGGIEDAREKESRDGMRGVNGLRGLRRVHALSPPMAAAHDTKLIEPAFKGAIEQRHPSARGKP